jgi:uncharacterized membrane protein YidH (DUF202 family)
LIIKLGFSWNLVKSVVFAGYNNLASMSEVTRAETFWMRLIGVLLILLGLLLLASPRISYSRREKVVDTDSIHITAKRQKSLAIPPAVSIITIGAGIAILILASRKPQ